MVNFLLKVLPITMFFFSCKKNTLDSLDYSAITRGISEKNITATAIVENSKIVRVKIILGYGSDSAIINDGNDSEKSIYIYEHDKLINTFSYDLDNVSIDDFLEKDLSNKFWGFVLKSIKNKRTD